MNKKKVLISGCSFSEKKHFQNSIYFPWSDFFQRDFHQKYCDVFNVAKSSYGQSMIVESLLKELIIHNFEVDYVFVQWSAIGRLYASNQKEFIETMIKQNELKFISHQHEYISKLNPNTLTGVTDLFDTIDDYLYTSSLLQILLMKNVLENHNIPYTMFWGWEQITNDIYEKNELLFSKIYDENFWRFGNHGGMSEYIIDTIGKTKGILPKDFHPTTMGQEKFYEDIIKPIANKEFINENI